MKLPKKKTPAKKQKQRASNMSDQDNTVVLGSGAIGAGTNYSISGAGIDTITLDPSIYTINTSITSPSTITWNQDYSTTIGSSWSNNANVNIDTDGISIKEGGDIKIAGKSLSEAIEKIEERLGILNPNPELEERWEQLKELRKQYIELEKDLLEKEKLMKILKEK
jgi:hypothetical protein